MVRNGRDWHSGADPGGRLQAGFCRLPRTSGLGLLIVFLLLTSGCVSQIQIRIGNKPDPDVLARSLRLGESTRDDVLATLGQPSGKGRAMLPFDNAPRTMWSYYYEEGDLKDARRIFLFIYFDEDRYGGYMWFSSLPK